MIIKKKLRVGIDYDQTYSDFPRFFDSIDGKKIIVTGRPKKDKPLLRKRLSPSYQIVVYPFNWPQHEAVESDKIVEAIKDIAKWKAKMVKEHNLDVFFEDDYRHAKVVKKKNPKCLVLLVL